MKITHLLTGITGAATVAVLSACGGGGGNSGFVGTPAVTERFLIDSPVQGVHYECGDIRGKTDSRGMFQCETAPVMFSLGQLQLVRLDNFTADDRVFLQDLYGQPRSTITDTQVNTLARFLQSLDDDGDISSSINIPENIAERFTQALDFNLVRVADLASIAGVNLISEAEAVNHLIETIDEYGLSSDDSTDGSGDNDGSGNDDDSIPGQNGTASALEGSWKLCQSVSGQSGQYSDSTTYTFTGNNFTEVVERHTDQDCAVKESTLSSYSGTFEIKESVSTPSGTATEIDFQYLTGFFANQQPKFYDIFLIDNGSLFKGSVRTGNTLSPEERPTDIDSTLPYINSSNTDTTDNSTTGGTDSGTNNTDDQNTTTSINSVGLGHINGHKFTSENGGSVVTNGFQVTYQEATIHCNNNFTLVQTVQKDGESRTNTWTGLYSVDSNEIRLNDSREANSYNLITDFSNGFIISGQSTFEGFLTIDSIEQVENCN